MNDKLTTNEVENIIEKALDEYPEGDMTTLEYLDWYAFLTTLTEVVKRCQDNSKLVLMLNRLEFRMNVRGYTYVKINDKYGLSYATMKGVDIEDS